MAHSLHEISNIVGGQISDEILAPSMLTFLQSKSEEVKLGALSNIDIFLANLSPESRSLFLPIIIHLCKHTGGKQW